MLGRATLVAIVVLAAASQDRPARGPAGRSVAQIARAAQAYDAWRRPGALVAALGLAPGARVADVGAGDGYLTTRLVDAVSPGGRVVATDIDRAALARLAEKAPAAETRVVPAGDPSLEAGGYDLVLLAQVDHLLDDRAAYFARLALALAPGGRLAVSNRLTYRDAVRDAAARAGLVEVPAPPLDLPGQFLLLYQQVKK